MTHDLVIVLKGIVRNLDEQIDFIGENAPKRLDRVGVILKSQASHFAYSAAGKKFAQDNNMESWHSFKYIDWLEVNYKFNISVDPIVKWEKYIQRISIEKDLFKVLKMYSDFQLEVNRFQEIISQTASSVEMYLQHQEDEYSGK